MKKKSNQPPASIYRTADFLADFPGLSEYPGDIRFPKPFTYGDYKKWFRSAFSNGSSGSNGSGPTPADVLLAQYRAAYEVVSAWNIRNVPKAAAAPEVNGKPNEDIPMEIVSFLVEMADMYIAPKILVETLQQVLLRRRQNPHPSPIFESAEARPLLPDLADYPGRATLARTMTTKTYRAWDKAMAVLEDVSPGDVENSILARQWRAALILIEDWKVEGVDRELLTPAGDEVPLVIVSWLVECADAYLGARLNLKKSRAMFAIG
ncbi:MAG: hypothetical protein L0332_06835 [Chloroflexi bacterium]|nr:hypothetical protein [Chloroflexota bacterium]